MMTFFSLSLSLSSPSFACLFIINSIKNNIQVVVAVILDYSYSWSLEAHAFDNDDLQKLIPSHFVCLV